MDIRSKTVLLLLFFINILYGQDFIFFNDAPMDTYYDQSFGFVNTPSYLDLAFNHDKIPVDTAHHFTGKNSLKLSWNSKSGGDWGIAVADSLWSGHDINLKDSIVLMVYSDSAILNSSLPKIYLEDLGNNKTSRSNIGDYTTSIGGQFWKRISIPLSIFKASPGNADVTKIKTIYFGQNISDSINHTLYLDDIRMISIGTSSVSIPTGVNAKGYYKHIDVIWNPNPENNIIKYNVYMFDVGVYKLIGSSPADILIYTDFLDSSDVSRKYKVSAVNSDNIESGLSGEDSASTYEMTDDQLLTMLQEATFRYFWDYAHPVSGLARERLGSGDVCAIGGSGFGIMAIIVGIERGFITRDQGTARILKILNFLTAADRFHGAFPHWMNGTTGKVIPFSTYDDGGDLVETSFMIQGLLTARKYFNKDNSDETTIRNLITNIWESVDWDWYKGPDQYSFTLYWHWSPDYGWMMNFPIHGYNEAMIVYLLAIASPTHSVSKYYYSFGWSGFSYSNGKSFYGIPLFVGQDYGGPLFFAHYSFLGFDPRNIKDKYANYFINNRNQTLINREYCISNPYHYAGYDSVTWGLTASDDPSGYDAHSPTNDNGTITPTAAISSMPYTPSESIEAFKNLYNKYGKKIWGPFGFKDAFNVSRNWYAGSYIAIDQGPIIDMVENYRSKLLWNNFMANSEIQPMLDSIGFKPDITGIENLNKTPDKFLLEGNYPNPFNPSTKIKFYLPARQNVGIKIFDILGREVRNLFDGECNSGFNEIKWNGLDNFGKSASSGIYLYTLRSNGKALTGKMILEK